MCFQYTYLIPKCSLNKLNSVLRVKRKVKVHWTCLSGNGPRSLLRALALPLLCRSREFKLLWTGLRNCVLFCTTTRPSPDYSGSLNSPPKRTMGGPNLEVFKFSVYVFFPVVMLFYYGNPDWYAKNVLPVRFALLRSCRIRCLDILLCSTRTGSSRLNTGSSLYVCTFQGLL